MVTGFVTAHTSADLFQEATMHGASGDQIRQWPFIGHLHGSGGSWTDTWLDGAFMLLERTINWYLQCLQANGLVKNKHSNAYGGRESCNHTWVRVQGLAFNLDTSPHLMVK